MMIIHIIINDKVEERYEFLKSIITKALPGTHFFCVKSSIDIESQKLVQDLQMRSDLVLHHCGTSNPEYKDFINSYRDFCKLNNFSCPPIVFFSGGGVSNAEKEFRGDSDIVVLSWTELKNKLPSFLSKFAAIDKVQLDLLRPKPAAYTLNALNILCQGFLMRLKLSPIENEKDGKKEIYKKAFSKVFGNEKTKTLIENVKKEWESLSSKADFNEAKFKSVENFIWDASSSNPKLDKSVIEDAYLALNERLGAASD